MNDAVVPTLDLLRDVPFRCDVDDTLAADIRACVAMPAHDATTRDARSRAAEPLVRTALAALDAEMLRLHRERFTLEDVSAIRKRLVDDPRARAEGIVASMVELVAADRQEWNRRFEKQVRDVLDAMRIELRRIDLERVPSAASTRVLARSGFRVRFERWSDAAMDAWSTQLVTLVEARYQELVAFELDQLESVLGAPVDAPSVSIAVPELRVRIAERLYETTYEPASIGASVLGQFKGGLDVVALLAGLIVVPLVGTLMGDAPVYARVGVVGAMVVLSLLASIASGMQARRRLDDTALLTARATIVDSVEASYVSQVERLRTELERRTVTAVREGLRATLRAASSGVAAFVQKRESSAVSVLADARMSADRIDDRLATLRALRRSIEDDLLVSLRRTGNGG